MAGAGPIGRPRRRRRPAGLRAKARGDSDGASHRGLLLVMPADAGCRPPSRGAAAVAAPPEATLAVTSLGLARFRSHLRARLELDARPVAVFGPNGAGKTNLIEAVSLLSPGPWPARGGEGGAGAGAGAGGVEGDCGARVAGRAARGRDLVRGTGAAGRDRRQAGEPDRARGGGAGALADAGDGPALARGREPSGGGSSTG